jgi:hypothetical protein
MNRIKKGGQVGDNSADLLLPNLPVENLLEDCSALFLRKLFVIKIVGIENQEPLLPGSVEGFDQRFGRILRHRGFIGHLLQRKSSGIGWRGNKRSAFYLRFVQYWGGGTPKWVSKCPVELKKCFWVILSFLFLFLFYIENNNKGNCEGKNTIPIF